MEYTEYRQVIMPYKFQTLKIKLPREYDRRVKITEQDKAEIKKMYFKEGLPIREITRRIGKISRRSIQIIIFPERGEKQKKDYKEREQSKKSYQKVKGKKWATIMKNHRRYKQKILKNEENKSKRKKVSSRSSAT